MTYSKLLELIEAMSDEQKNMSVVISVGGEWSQASVVTTLCHTDEGEEGYPVGQPVLE